MGKKLKKTDCFRDKQQKMKLAHPPTLPSVHGYLLNSSSLAIYKAKKEITAASTTDISEYPIPRKYCNCKKNTIRKLISIMQQTLQKKLVEFWNRSNHMRQQQTILVIKLQQSFILPFFFDCKKTYSLSLISENQNIIIDKAKLEKRNVIIDYSLLSIQF